MNTAIRISVSRERSLRNAQFTIDGFSFVIFCGRQPSLVVYTYLTCNLTLSFCSRNVEYIRYLPFMNDVQSTHCGEVMQLFKDVQNKVVAC